MASPPWHSRNRSCSHPNRGRRNLCCLSPQSTYTQDPPQNSIQRLLHFAETHGIILVGDFNAKGLFDGQADVPNPAGREVDVFFQRSSFTIPSFPENPTFICILDSGDVQASILYAVFASSENYWIELDEPLFQLDGHHLPVCFTISTPDHFLIPDVAPPKFTMSQLLLPLFSKSSEARSSSPLHLSTPSIPAELDSLVTSMTEAIDACMRQSLVPDPLLRRLVPFSDNQLTVLNKKKNKARARGDTQTYKRFRRSFRSCFKAKRTRWQTKLGEQICPSTAWSTVHLLHRRPSKKKPKINPVPGEPSADRSAAELTAKFASISNDRLIARDSQDN